MRPILFAAALVLGLGNLSTGHAQSGENVIVLEVPADVAEAIGTGNADGSNSGEDVAPAPQPGTKKSIFEFETAEQNYDAWAALSRDATSALANNFLIRAAELGHAEAQFELGMRYSNAQKYETAIKWLTLADEQGHRKAHFALGDAYIAQGTRKLEAERQSNASSCQARVSADYLFCETYASDCVMGGCAYEWSCRNERRVSGSNGRSKGKVIYTHREEGACKEPKSGAGRASADIYCDPATGVEANSFDRLIARTCQ